MTEYLYLAIVAGFAFVYSVVAGRVDRLPLSGPIVFTIFGLASIVFAIIAVDRELVGAETLAGVVACTVLLSVFAHGALANPLVESLGKRLRPDVETNSERQAPKGRHPSSTKRIRGASIHTTGHALTASETSGTTMAPPDPKTKFSLLSRRPVGDDDAHSS
jgi:hypothetical protein